MKDNLCNLLVLTTIQYLTDILMNPCSNIKGHVLLYFHHIIDIYIYFGSFLFDPLHHLIVISLTVLHWITNDNKCILTEWLNEVCYPEYTEYKGFNDFSRMIGLQDEYPNISYYYILSIAIYDIYLLYNSKKI